MMRLPSTAGAARLRALRAALQRARHREAVAWVRGHGAGSGALYRAWMRARVRLLALRRAAAAARAVHGAGPCARCYVVGEHSDLCDAGDGWGQDDGPPDRA